MTDLKYAVVLVNLMMIVVLSFFRYRAQWLDSERLEQLYKDLGAFNNGPSYNYMLWTFWIWDIARYYPFVITTDYYRGPVQQDQVNEAGRVENTARRERLKPLDWLTVLVLFICVVLLAARGLGNG